MDIRAGTSRLRASALLLGHASLGAALAWLVATEGLGHERPFFAPVAAVICLGLSFGQRTRRTVEVIGGVALGIVIGDVVAEVAGRGTWQLGLAVGAAMAVALLIGTGQLLATQAAVSAALVVVLEPPGSGLTGERFLDAAVGGGVALAISALVFPANPMTMVRRAAAPVLAELSATLEDIAVALETGDREAAVASLARARGIDAEEAELREALDAGRDTARSAPPRRGSREHLELYATAEAQLDLAVRNVRVLARGSVRAIELGDNVPPRVPEALRSLATAVRRLGVFLDDPEGEPGARAAAIEAAALATAVLEQTANLSVSVIVGQIRSTAVDLLRGMGEDPLAARAAVRAATPT
jgi:uncharacterized membrane protein YgaE (UPF0421/DUF939 family)